MFACSFRQLVFREVLVCTTKKFQTLMWLRYAVVIPHANAARVSGDTHHMIIYRAEQILVCTRHNYVVYTTFEHSQLLKEHHGCKRYDKSKAVFAQDNENATEISCEFRCTATSCIQYKIIPAYCELLRIKLTQGIRLSTYAVAAVSSIYSCTIHKYAHVPGTVTPCTCARARGSAIRTC